MAPSRRALWPALVGLALLLATGCYGEQRSFASTKLEAVPTSVSGTSNTSGISAGAALSAPTSDATPTSTPTVTPVPGK